MDGIKRLWNKNFTILWQGQLISDFGNAAFSVALGFWVLEMTKTAAMPAGNLALMGLIEALFALPGVLLGPFAGAIADRHSRKWIIISADFMRGLIFTSMGAMVLFHVFPFWAIYPLAILAGASGAFFGPAISSVIPDIVPRDSLTKANSARSLSSTSTQLLGNSLGGMLYALLTAPVLILINGLSFLYASATQLFMKVPLVVSSGQKKHIMGDMADGIKYAFGNRGIRALLIMCLITNFFAVVGLTLLTPLFKNTPGFGVERYGYVMGTMMAGAVVGMLALSAIKIRAQQRSWVFGVTLLVEVSVVVPIGFIMNVIWLYPLAFVAGISNAIVNVMVQTITQATVPQEKRGKVFGILGTVSGALMPLAMATSGIVAGFAGVRPTIVGAFVMVFIGSLPLLFSRHFREFINTDIEASKSAAVLDQSDMPAMVSAPEAEGLE